MTTAERLTGPAQAGPGAPPREPDADDRGARLRWRGRFWLAAGFAVCPCHLPFTLIAVGALLGGTAVGDAVTGNPLVVAVVLGAVTALAYRRGLRLLRAADACAAGACRPAVRSREGAG
jgi:hypothetical protein